MAIIKIAPTEGSRLLNHQRGYREIPTSGEDVVDDHHFRRRIADGDARIVTDPKPEPVTKAQADVGAAAAAAVAAASTRSKA